MIVSLGTKNNSGDPSLGHENIGVCDSTMTQEAGIAAGDLLVDLGENSQNRG